MEKSHKHIQISASNVGICIEIKLWHGDFALNQTRNPYDCPIEVGRSFQLLPEEALAIDDLADTGERIPIYLCRGKAFGSGLHETTVSCMEVLENLAPLEGKMVLDVGTGTGILAMTAILLGARCGVALDIDNDAVLTCSRNAALNRMNERLWTFQGTVDALNRAARFDLVLANVHGDIILKETHRLMDHTREKGFLVLSGLDYTDSRPVKAAMKKQGMEEVSIFFLGEYVTQVWHRPQGRD